jgi:hypothetical protein
MHHCRGWIPSISTCSRLLFAMLAIGGPARITGAQAAPPARSAVLWIARETVKPGHELMHTRHETQWAAALNAAGFNVPMLGMVSVSGPPEAWWLIPGASFAEMDKAMAAFSDPKVAPVMEKYSAADAAHMNQWRGMQAAHRADLSNGPPANIALARGMDVGIWRVKPGHDGRFAEAVKLWKTLMSRAGVTNSFAVYEVVSGAPAGTYLIFSALRSGEYYDQMMANQPKIVGKATEEEGALLNRFLTESLISNESSRFAIDPNITSAPPDWIAQDAAFWTPSWKKAPARTRP